MRGSYKRYTDWQCEFDHKYCCWANNHMGWAKMKKFNKRRAKKRIRRMVRREVERVLDDVLADI